MKYKAAIALTALSAATSVETQKRPSVAPKNMQTITSALANYTDTVLFGDVWLRPDLTPRDRRLVHSSVCLNSVSLPRKMAMDLVYIPVPFWPRNWAAIGLDTVMA